MIFSSFIILLEFLLAFTLAYSSILKNSLNHSKVIEIEDLTNGTNQKFGSNKVIGGRDAVDGERSFQVVLLDDDKFMCGGSLINRQAVLTAAHCIDGVPTQKLKIRYNTLKQSTGPTIEVKKAIPHPNYDKKTVDNDIAILILSSAFNPSNNAQTINILPYFEPNAGSIVTISGWGRTSTVQGGYPENLKVANLTVVERSDCRQRWLQNPIGSVPITNNMICASDFNGRSCNGDSGGPVTHKIADQHFLVGVVSFGPILCYDKNIPSGFARTGNYFFWINEQLNREL